MTILHRNNVYNSCFKSNRHYLQNPQIRRINIYKFSDNIKHKIQYTKIETNQLVSILNKYFKSNSTIIFFNFL